MVPWPTSLVSGKEIHLDFHAVLGVIRGRDSWCHWNDFMSGLIVRINDNLHYFEDLQLQFKEHELHAKKNEICKVQMRWKKSALGLSYSQSPRWIFPPSSSWVHVLFETFNLMLTFSTHSVIDSLLLYTDLHDWNSRIQRQSDPIRSDQIRSRILIQFLKNVVSAPLYLSCWTT